MAKGNKTGGRQRGTPNRRTTEALERERVARQAQQEVDKARAANTKLGKDVLEEFMKTFAGMAAYYQPVPEGMPIPSGRKPSEDKFLTYARLTVETARDLANFQSPRFRAVQIMTPPANPLLPAKAGNVHTIDDPAAVARLYQNMVKQVR